jgi:hypothetical protein
MEEGDGFAITPEAGVSISIDWLFFISHSPSLLVF